MSHDPSLPCVVVLDGGVTRPGAARAEPGTSVELQGCPNSQLPTSVCIVCLRDNLVFRPAIGNAERRTPSAKPSYNLQCMDREDACRNRFQLNRASVTAQCDRAADRLAIHCKSKERATGEERIPGA